MSSGRFFRGPSPSDWQRWEQLLEQCAEPPAAAQSLGYTSSRFRREDPDRHAAALELSREARSAYADERGEAWALADDAPPVLRLAWLKRWNAMWRDGRRSS